jgi:large subunit ribosomal protein L4
MSNPADIEISVVDASNSERGKVALPAAFAAKVSEGAMFEQVLAQRASQRRGSAATKTRSVVSGGGKKPWRQKGTGNARAGSNRSPLWRGGATVHGPHPRSYAYRLPKRARRAALCSALTQKARDGQVRVIESFAFEAPKTKAMRQLLSALDINDSVLIVLPEHDAAVELSARNLPRVQATTVDGLNVYDVLRYEILLVAKDALAKIEERLAR